MSSNDSLRLVSDFETVLGYCFKEPRWVLEALTHTTYANESSLDAPDNERLEFVGDAALGLLAASRLYELFPLEDEGALSQRRARVVCREALASYAHDLKLGDYLRVGHGEKRSDGKIVNRVLADGFEAIVGAVYMDGGLEAVETCFGAVLYQALMDATNSLDFKTTFQELCHRRAWMPPSYRLIEAEGPAHSRKYVCGVWVDQEKMGQGEGSSKKKAEQKAAQAALTQAEER